MPPPMSQYHHHSSSSMGTNEAAYQMNGYDFIGASGHHQTPFPSNPSMYPFAQHSQGEFQRNFIEKKIFNLILPT
jgi:hypothetical protein